MKIICNVAELNPPTAESFVEYVNEKFLKLSKFVSDSDQTLSLRVIKNGKEFVVSAELKGDKYNFFSSEANFNFRLAVNKLAKEMVQMCKKKKEISQNHVG